MFLKWKTKKKGFLLLEVLFTVSILSVGIVLIIQSQMSSLRATVYADDFLKASFLLRNKMNEFLEQSVVDKNLDEQDFFNSPYESFSYNARTIEPECQDYCEGLKEIVLTVLWKKGKRANSITASSYVFSETSNDFE